MGEVDARREWIKCRRSAAYFIHNYCMIYDATSSTWIPFHLWPGQITTLQTMSLENLVIVLKARQLGLTWLVLCFSLWLAIFHPAKTVLLFSRRDDEAIYLLDRVKNIYKRLPQWAQVRKVPQSSSHIWHLSNESIFYAFPTTAGDSYTASLVIVDEADLVPDLDNLMNAVKPTIDGGGRMILLSRANKDTPGSSFKRIFIAASKGLSPWKAVFLPWYTRPSRDQKWYQAQYDDILTRTGTLDDLYQQYPATIEQALQPRSLDKRFISKWVHQNALVGEVITEEVDFDIPASALLYEHYDQYCDYRVAIDAAEGNVTSDDSVVMVYNATKKCEVCTLAGHYEPSTTAYYANQLSLAYGNAPILCERNNHGHAVLLELVHLKAEDRLLKGPDDKPGWLTSQKGKVLMWKELADALKDKEAKYYTEEIGKQIESIDGTTQSAPEGMHDDYAIAFALCICASKMDPGLCGVLNYAQAQRSNGLNGRNNRRNPGSVRGSVPSGRRTAPTRYRHR